MKRDKDCIFFYSCVLKNCEMLGSCAVGKIVENGNYYGQAVNFIQKIVDKDREWESFDVMVAHVSSPNELPNEFKHELTVKIKGEDGMSLMNEICNLMEENQVRDCKWQFKRSEFRDCKWQFNRSE